MTYPIAEVFHSLQGEGVWTGTPMCFIRFAGCNVGKYQRTFSETDAPFMSNRDFPLFRDMRHALCRTVDGQHFLCDTDYHRTLQYSAEALGMEVYEEHVCLTGGEPFLHDLKPLVDFLHSTGTQVHIETSGTIAFPEWASHYDDNFVWISCSPKDKFLEENWIRPDEWKFLVGPDLDVAEILIFLQDDTRPVFLQPMGGVHDIDNSTTQKVLEILKEHPEWRMSAQLHKYLRVR